MRLHCARSQFVNSCIDESVRLHTMLPGNTVLRKTLSDIRLLDVDIPADSLIWLYPNAVHQDEECARAVAPLPPCPHAPLPAVEPLSYPPVPAPPRGAQTLRTRRASARCG